MLSVISAVIATRSSRSVIACSRERQRADCPRLYWPTKSLEHPVHLSDVAPGLGAVALNDHGIVGAVSLGRHVLKWPEPS